MGGDNFRKDDDFRKTAPAPDCAKCGMMTNDNIESNVRNAHAWCNRCEHEVDKEGKCVATGRCVACRGRPECSRCGGITDKSSDNAYRFECNKCNHQVDDDGDCKKEECRTCDPYQCGTCGDNLNGELDDDGEIYCYACEHTVDRYGDCVASGHCETCMDYPDCPGCESGTYEDGYEDDDDDYVLRYFCEGECEHSIHSDGDCVRVYGGQSCTDCDTPCSECGAFECRNDPCDWERDGECRFCHCHDEEDEDMPNCPDCGDNEDVEGPDDDGDYWCTYEECDSGEYFQ